MRRSVALIGSCALLLGAVGAGIAADDPAPSLFREGFEGPKPNWRREQTDATVSLEAHDRSTRAAHEGKTSERFLFKAGPGSVLYFSQAVPRVAIADDAQASVYVRANRPGVQLFGRVVLPADIDPETGRPSFLLIPGETLRAPDRWERLELKDLRAELARQARVLRIGTERRVSLEGAYLERLVVNLYGGAGETEVFLDELSVGPVMPEEPDANANENAKDNGPLAPLPVPVENNPAEPPRPRDTPKDTAKVRMQGPQLMRDNEDWFPSIIHAPGADPTTLFQMGFYVLALDRDAPDRVAEEASRAGLMLMPSLDIRSGTPPETILAGIERYPYLDHVAIWNLGDDLGAPRDLKVRQQELERARQVILGLQALPEGRPRVSFGTIYDDLPLYALAGRNLDVLGIESGGWATMRDPLQTRAFLAQRRDLVSVRYPHAPFVAWIDAAAPPNASRNVWGLDDPPSWGRPQVQPEQIRMNAYAALMAGYRGLAYHADSEITAESGRARLLEMGLLNAELELVEPILARGPEPIQAWNAFEADPEQILVYNASGAGAGFNQARSNKSTRPAKERPPHMWIKVASIPTVDGRGRLLLVNDMTMGSQYQPPQMAANNLKIVIQAPENAQGFEITPAGVQVLERDRTTGGQRLTVPLFSGTTMILLTPDLSMKDRLEAAVRRTAPMASQFAIEQARLQIRETAEINAQLATEGHRVRDAEDLIRQAEDHLKAAIEAHERLDYQLSWMEARWVGRALRVLRKNHYAKAYDAAVKVTNRLAKAEDPKGPFPWFFPIAMPPLTAFQTLPEAFHWIDVLGGRAGPFGPNLAPSGDFDGGGLGALARSGWTDVGRTIEDAEGRIQVIQGAGYAKTKADTNDALRLVVVPKDLTKGAIDKIQPFLDHEVAAVRSPEIPVVRDRLYRIRVLLHISQGTTDGTGGVFIRDSIGGEPLQFRISHPIPFWREVVLYRLAPEDGVMTVTLGLAAYGEVYFDRFQVEAVEGTGSGPQPEPPGEERPIARRPAPPSANPPIGRNPTEARPRR